MLQSTINETVEKLREVKGIAGKFLRLRDYNVIDVCLSAFVGNKLDGDPLWILLRGAPSSVKFVFRQRKKVESNI